MAQASTEPTVAAAEARLRYVSDEDPGIRRVRAGAGFRFLDPKGRVVRDAATLARIRALAIPPAWTEVWICPDAEGHIQAVGRDGRGRKQYRYHARWREVRDRTKFGRMVKFAQLLPRLRTAVARDLARPGLPRERVLATVVRLLETTSIRVGSDEYARQNEHYGLTTLRDEHVKVKGADLRFSFCGKSGKDHEVGLHDPRLAKLVRACQEVPGQRLFQYVDDSGDRHPIGSADVNDYLRALTGEEITAKDFRTWAGTVAVAGALLGCEAPTTKKALKREVIAAIDQAAARLGNTRSVCRSSYVHPAVLEAFEEGWIKSPPPCAAARRPAPRGLDPLEVATLRLLEAAASRPVRTHKKQAA